MDRKTLLTQVKEYNTGLKKRSLSRYQKHFVEVIEQPYFFTFQSSYRTREIDDDVEVFLRRQNNFEGLLQEHNKALCLYIRHMTSYSYTSGFQRIAMRSEKLSLYEAKLYDVIGAFYLFYAGGLDIEEAVRGMYRELDVISFAPVIASALLANDEKAIHAAKEVLTSENNVGVLTRDLIVAIEQSHNEELQNLLLQVFLAARLQEGLRQSVAETCDENQMGFFLKTIELIIEHNLLRYSSIQRAIMTWCGIGYQEVEEKQVGYMLSRIAVYMKEEKLRKEAISSQNPLDVYLALYVQGTKDVTYAMQEALLLCTSSQKQQVSSAMVFLEAVQSFHSQDHLELFQTFQDDSAMLALLYRHFTLRAEDRKRFANADEAYAFFLQCVIYQNTIKNQQTFTSKGFPWYHSSISKDQLSRILYVLVKQYPQERFVKAFLPYAYRVLYGDELRTFLALAGSLLKQEDMFSYLCKNIIVGSEEAQKMMKEQLLKMKLSEAELMQLEERLKTKKGSARAQIIDVLAHQTKDQIEASYQRLHQDTHMYRKEAAKELYQKAGLTLPQETKEEKQITYDLKKGLSLYTIDVAYSLPLVDKLPRTTIKRGLFKKEEVVDLSHIFVKSASQIESYFKTWSIRYQTHELEEYEHFGSVYQLSQGLYRVDYKEKGLKAYPLEEVWRNYFKEDKLRSEEVFLMVLYTWTLQDEVAFHQLFSNIPNVFSLSEKVKDFPYIKTICDILQAYGEEVFKEHRDVFIKQAKDLLQALILTCKKTYYEKTNHRREKEKISYGLMDSLWWLLSILSNGWQSDAEFKDVFPVLFAYFDHFTRKSSTDIKVKYVPSSLCIAKAVQLQLVSEELLYEVILHPYSKGEVNTLYYQRSETHLFEAIRDAYFQGMGYHYTQPSRKQECFDSRYDEALSYLQDAVDEITHRMLLTEYQRINEKTSVSDEMSNIGVVFGLRNLIDIVHAMGKENFSRRSYGTDKKDVLSHLVKVCYPLEDDDIAWMKEAKISDERWVEVAMLAPQWINTIAQYLQWDGFKEGCYYFIAHMKDDNDDKKKAEIAKYTDLDPMDLRDGAFDATWCKEVYAALQKKRFMLLYQAAKFLCENAAHTRARKYADAVLGNTKKEALYQQASEKRNKDALNAYCLVPLKDDTDLLERYLYVQQFAKEAKQFGAQRQASEKRCAQIAMMNLARNSRFQNETRLTWMMETQQVTEHAHFLQPQTIDVYEIQIVLDEQGKNNVVIKKDGKKLSSVPAKLKKHPHFLEVQDIHKQWNEQYRRGRAMLEDAMCERTIFTREELHVMMHNPIISKMVEKLILKQQNTFGFYNEGELETLQGIIPLADEVQLAHPYDLYDADVWHHYQSYVFAHQLTQPFKQVFRELYVKLEDEKPSTHSMRYSGYQIQTKKFAAALKSRKWNLSYESGLERVYYQANLVVQLWAEADWFSPSDIESPSIDYVSFQQRKTGAGVSIQAIDDVLYSEVMRDLDMAVSISYVGGVDPQTSFATLELRKTILTYTMTLLKLKNVEIQDHFANITGTLNDYSVHLGSGSVHQQLAGAMHIVKIPSQKRGKLYLPFLDEDPKTAEILSKILLLAQDQKIKDPTILAQIQRRK